MSRIDDAVARVLRLKYRLGLFENPYWDIRKYDKFGSEEFAKVALQAAEESEILLKNENNVLPPCSGKENSADRTQCQLHALSERRLVVFLAGRSGRQLCRCV